MIEKHNELVKHKEALKLKDYELQEQIELGKKYGD